VVLGHLPHLIEHLFEVVARRQLERREVDVGHEFLLPQELADGQEVYDPDETRPPTGNEDWQRWEFVYTGNARVPCWIVRVPKEIIWGHGGLWSDNSVAMFGALYRMHFPLDAEGQATSSSQHVRIPKAPDTRKLNEDKLH
jgi:hypothetical protein